MTIPKTMTATIIGIMTMIDSQTRWFMFASLIVVCITAVAIFGERKPEPQYIGDAEWRSIVAAKCSTALTAAERNFWCNEGNNP